MQLAMYDTARTVSTTTPFEYVKTKDAPAGRQMKCKVSVNQNADPSAHAQSVQKDPSIATRETYTFGTGANERGQDTRRFIQ